MTGTGTLIRFLLRRDRIKLPAWIAGLGLLVLYVGAALPQIARTEADLAGVAPMLQQPVGRLFTGPAYGLDAPTYERFFAAEYVLYLFLLAAVMNIMLVTRHTRAEEQSGRAELVRASVVGRDAALTATLAVAVVANLLAGVVVAGLAVASGFATAGSILVGASVAAIGLAFAGISAVTVQITEFSRSAAGLAGIVLGAAFLLRGVGDMIAIGGSAASWLSPLGWGSQTAPYVLDRWWPLLLPVALALVTVVMAYRLQARRDFGAGLVAPGSGRPEAAPSLGSPWGLASRLQRGPVIAWGVVTIVMGVVDGLFAQVMIDSAGSMPDAFRQVFGTEALTKGYLAFLAILSGYLVAAYIVFAVQGLHGEETHGRAEVLLATPTSRDAWAGSHLGIIAIGAAVIMAVTGLLTGVAAASVTGDWSLLASTLLAHLNLIPAVLVVVGVCAVLFGWVPRLLSPIGWLLVAIMVFVGNFAALLNVPDWVVSLSPLSHPARIPVEAFTVAPLVILAVLTVVGLLVGLLGLRRREVADRA